MSQSAGIGYVLALPPLLRRLAGHDRWKEPISTEPKEPRALAGSELACCCRRPAHGALRE